MVITARENWTIFLYYLVGGIIWVSIFCSVAISIIITLIAVAASAK